MEPIHAIITGATGVVGRAIARELAAKRAHLALIARRSEPLGRLAAEVADLGGAASVFPCDLTDTAALGPLVHAVVERLGHVNALVHSAGLFDWAPAQDAELSTWDRVLDVNLRAVVHLTRHVVPFLGRRGSSAIVHIASVAGKDHLAKGAIYSAAKFGVFGFAGCLFEDVRDMGIKVCTIGPGQVASRIDHAPPTPSAHIPPQDVARVVSFVLEFPGTSCPTEILLRAQRSPGG